VTLTEFTFQVSLQKLTNERVTFEKIRKALGELTFDASIVEQSGPALNSGRAMLLYGPPRQWQDQLRTFAEQRLQRCDLRALCDYHRGPDHLRSRPRRSSRSESHPPWPTTGWLSFVRAEEYDARWVPCRRPFVATGGELTLEMLELRYDPAGHFYEAPLHMKALGAVFVIDDFGRQLVSPTSLLNRWIVPLENRVDYLKLHTGKSFSIPFEELVIFSTNLEPEDLMDPASCAGFPTRSRSRRPAWNSTSRSSRRSARGWDSRCPAASLTASCGSSRWKKGLELAAYQPSSSSIRWWPRAGSWAGAALRAALHRLCAEHLRVKQRTGEGR